MNALGVPLDGEASGSLGGGSPASGPYGVDADAGVNPVVCDCSLIRANSDHCRMWWG